MQSLHRRFNRRILPRLLAGKFGTAALNPDAFGAVALFPRLGLAYNRIKKNANSSTMAALYRLETGRAGEGRESKVRVSSLAKASLLLVPRLSRLSYFTILRNPYSRVLSAFLNKFAKPEYVAEFGSFALDVNGFSAFIGWLDQGALDKDGHWDLQSKALFTAPSHFDEVLLFEEFPGNLIEMLTGRGVELPSDLDGILGTANETTRTRATQRLVAFYTPGIARRVEALFGQDFDVLHYSNDFGVALAATR